MDTLTALLEESARRYPDNTATVIRAGIRTARLSYAQLEQRAHAFATLVRDRQVGPGDRVVIWAANQPDWVAAMFGTFLAGAVVVPLDVGLTLDIGNVVRVTWPMDDLDAGVLGQIVGDNLRTADSTLTLTVLV